MNDQVQMNEKIASAKKIAVLQVSTLDEALFSCEELLKSGVNAVEIPYRNQENFSLSDSFISEIRKRFPEILIGGATVINPLLAERAFSSGAQFILSPGLNEKTVLWCRNKNLPCYPGVITPSEIENALRLNLSVLKLFPVENFGGLSYLKALKGPFPDVKFIVSGGINFENESEYENFPNVLAVSGSYLLKGIKK